MPKHISPYSHRYASLNLVIMGLANDFLPVWHQAIISTNGDFLADAPQKYTVIINNISNCSVLLGICAGRVTLMLCFTFYLHLNKRLSKQSWSWWFEMPSCPLWPHCNAGVVPQCRDDRHKTSHCCTLGTHNVLEAKDNSHGRFMRSELTFVQKTCYCMFLMIHSDLNLPVSK